MTELQQARADWLAALGRISKLEKENSDLLQRNFELTMKLSVSEVRAITAEALGTMALKCVLTS